MHAIRTTRRLLTAYVDRGAWSEDQDEEQVCRDLAEKLTWGTHIYQGLLDLEARTQAQSFRRPSPETDLLLELMPLLYQLWTEASDFYLTQAHGFREKGCEVAGIAEFQHAVTEARCLLNNLELEDEIRPIEELIGQLQPANPHPERYIDE